MIFVTVIKHSGNMKENKEAYKVINKN